MANGYKAFTAGAVLAAADVKDYLMLQSKMEFATAAARDSALGGVLRHGMFAYLQDTPRRLTYYDGSAWQTMASEVTTWSPSHANLTVGNGTVTARYGYIGMRQVRAAWRFVLGSTSAMGTAPTVTLPVAPATAMEVDSTPLRITDADGTNYFGHLEFVSGSTVRLRIDSIGASYVQVATVTATQPMTWTTSDAVSFWIDYET